MGYSGRYHAASLVAVFIALAIGILIGIGLADDVVSSASQELERSLRDERDQAEDDAAALRDELGAEEQFGDAAYRTLVDDMLAGRRFAVVELGDVPDDGVDATADAAIDAAEQAGGVLASVSSITLPLDTQALADQVGGGFRSVRRDAAALERLGRLIGIGLTGGGALIDRVKPELFTRFNGSLEDVTLLILIRNPPDGLGEGQQADYDAFEGGIIEGARAGAAGVVGVERTSTDPTTLGAFSDRDVATVDNVDRPAGKVSVVYALDGAEGDFGVKDGASSLLPELQTGVPAR